MPSWASGFIELKTTTSLRHLASEDNEKTVYATSSLTDSAVQLGNTFTIYTPNPELPNALITYKEQLPKGVVFSSNEYGDSKVYQSELHEEKELIVLTKQIALSSPMDWHWPNTQGLCSRKSWFIQIITWS